MTPTNSLVNRLPILLAGDANSLSSATAMHVHLVQDAIAPGPDTDFTVLTECDFDGYAAIDVEIGDQDSYYDPVLEMRVVQLIPPVGGWKWETTGVTNLPQTAQAIVLTDTADTTTWGSQLLTSGPVILTESGQAVIEGVLTFAIPYTALQ
jgi:hypothetical protein